MSYYSRSRSRSRSSRSYSRSRSRSYSRSRSRSRSRYRRRFRSRSRSRSRSPPYSHRQTGSYPRQQRPGNPLPGATGSFTTRIPEQAKYSPMEASFGRSSNDEYDAFRRSNSYAYSNRHMRRGDQQGPPVCFNCSQVWHCYYFKRPWLHCVLML